MTKIIPGIYQLKIPIPNNPLGFTNTYLLQGNDGDLLIDTGVDTEEALQSLEKQLAEIGVHLKDITQIVITHSHHDHYGLAGRLRPLCAAKIFLHHLEEKLITRNMDIDELNRQSEQWLHVNGAPANMLTAFPGMVRLNSFPSPDVTLQGGETLSAGIFKLQVVWTPGHSPGHICLFEPTQKILFTGDHILPVITPNVSLQSHLGGNPLADYLNSLNRVRQLEVNLVLPAHEYIFTNLPGRVDEILWHHQQRHAEILVILKTEPKTAYQVATDITWLPEQGGKRFKDLPPWDKRLATLETLAHLEVIRANGRIDKSFQDSIAYYQLS